MADIKKYTISQEEVKEKYGNIEEDNYYNRSLKDFFKEKQININNKGKLFQYAHELAYKMRSEDLSESVFKELDYLKKHSDENKQLVKYILYGIRLTLKQIDSRERYEAEERLFYEEEERKYRDQVFDYYNDDYNRFFAYDDENQKGKSY